MCDDLLCESDLVQAGLIFQLRSTHVDAGQQIKQRLI
jgi:hypothetical protein